MVFDYLKCYVDIINSFKTSIWTYCIIPPPPAAVLGGGEIDHMVRKIFSRREYYMNVNVDCLYSFLTLPNSKKFSCQKIQI